MAVHPASYAGVLSTILRAISVNTKICWCHKWLIQGNMARGTASSTKLHKHNQKEETNENGSLADKS
jgi:hypothetical protein